MKNKEKPSFASLNPSLLARKGGARPAMRPQLQPMPASENGQHNGQQNGHSLEDLGWNDMGHDSEEDRHADPLPLTPAPASPETETAAEAHAEAGATEVHRQQEVIADRLSSAPVAQVPAQEPAPKATPKAAPAKQEEPKPKAIPAVRTTSRRRPNGHALPKGKRAAFTLRLDQSRHLKLRLACTMNNRSAQQIVTEALDSFLDEIPELNSLAARVKRH